MTVRRAAFGVYWACLAVLAVLALGWVWMGFYFHSIVEVLTWLLLLPTLGTIVVETAMRFSKRKLVGTLGALVLVGVIVAAYPVLEWWPSVQLFYRTRARAANELAREALGYGSIQQLTVFGISRSLNQMTIIGPERLAFEVTYNRPEKIVVDTARQVFRTEPYDLIPYDSELLDDVLALVPQVTVDTVADSLAVEWVAVSPATALRRAGVEDERYEHFTARLERLGFWSMEVGPRHVIFGFGKGCEPGCLFAYLPDGPLAADERLPRVGRWSPTGSHLRRVAADWYYW